MIVCATTPQNLDLCLSTVESGIEILILLAAKCSFLLTGPLVSDPSPRPLKMKGHIKLLE